MQLSASRYINKALLTRTIYLALDRLGVLPEVLLAEPDPNKVLDLDGFCILEKTNPSPANWMLPYTCSAAASQHSWEVLVQLQKRYGVWVPTDKIMPTLRAMTKRVVSTAAWFGPTRTLRWSDVTPAAVSIVLRSCGGSASILDNTLQVETDHGACGVRPGALWSGYDACWVPVSETHPDMTQFNAPPIKTSNPVAVAMSDAGIYGRMFHMLAHGADRSGLTLEQLAEAYRGKGRDGDRRRLVSETVFFPGTEYLSGLKVKQ